MDKQYLKEIRKYHPLSKSEEQELLKKMKEGDSSAREKLIQHNLLWVVKQAKLLYNPYVSEDDLIQVGNLALCMFIESVDGKKGRVLTYLRRVIKYMMCCYINKIQKSVNFDYSKIKVRKQIDIDILIDYEKYYNDIVRMVVEGYTCREIGKMYGCSGQTILNKLKKIREKKYCNDKTSI